MKRMILAVVAALTLTAGVWAQEAVKVPVVPVAPAASLESYVPSDAMVYVRYQGFVGASKTFQQT
jgi:hypothetical protein